MTINTHLSIIIINIDELNAPIKRQMDKDDVVQSMEYYSAIKRMKSYNLQQHE